MSISIQNTRRRLPIYYLIAALMTALCFALIPFRQLYASWWTILLAPLWLVVAHLACGIAFSITYLSIRKAFAFLKGSVSVYGQLGSLVHLQAAFLVSLFEENIFRYALQSYLQQVLGHWLTTLLIVSILFAAGHLRGLKIKDFLRGIDLFVFSILLGGLTLITASLYPAVIVHGMRNYILRCMLISREEWEALHRKRQS